MVRMVCSVVCERVCVWCELGQGPGSPLYRPLWGEHYTDPGRAALALFRAVPSSLTIPHFHAWALCRPLWPYTGLAKHVLAQQSNKFGRASCWVGCVCGLVLVRGHIVDTSCGSSGWVDTSSSCYQGSHGSPEGHHHPLQ